MLTLLTALALAAPPADQVVATVDLEGSYTPSGPRTPGTTTLTGELDCAAGWARGAAVELVLRPSPTVQPSITLTLLCPSTREALPWTASFVSFGGDVNVTGELWVEHPSGRWRAGTVEGGLVVVP
jgi:hypothetical protein